MVKFRKNGVIMPTKSKLKKLKSKNKRNRIKNKKGENKITDKLWKEGKNHEQIYKDYNIAVNPNKLSALRTPDDLNIFKVKSFRMKDRVRREEKRKEKIEKTKQQKQNLEEFSNKIDEFIKEDFDEEVGKNPKIYESVVSKFSKESLDILAKLIVYQEGKSEHKQIDFDDNDFKSMALNIKLNYLQWSPSQIKNKIKIFNGYQSYLERREQFKQKFEEKQTKIDQQREEEERKILEMKPENEEEEFEKKKKIKKLNRKKRHRKMNKGVTNMPGGRLISNRTGKLVEKLPQIYYDLEKNN